ncbi:restriction endonuclease subunit S [Clostridium perfringens]|nr:restriction endonuclease subunit S [Clostridium perfringens]
MSRLAQELRDAVLNTALLGGLTKRLPTDSNTNDFVTKIKEKKELLVLTKEISKEIKLEEITENSIPFEIPETWVWEKIGNLFYIERGASPRPIASYITTDKNGVNWIKIGDTVPGEKYVNSTKEKITLEGAKKSRKVKKGDFIFSNSMSFGRPYILNIDGYIHDGWNVIHNIDIVNPDKSITKFNADYLYYVLSSNVLQKQILSKADGGVVKNIRSNELRNLLIPIPPIEEQKRIADKIEELMMKIDDYEKVENKIEKLKKNFPIDLRDSILQAAMQGKLTEQLPTDGNIEKLLTSIKENRNNLIERNEIKLNKNSVTIEKNGESFFAISNVSGKKIDITEEIPFEIPDTWAWIKFGDLANQKMGKTPERANSLNWNMDNNWVSIADMPANGYLSTTKEGVSNDCLKKYFNDKKSPAGTLIMSFKLTVGRVSILNIPAVHNEAIISIYPYVNKDNICRDYLFKVLPMLSNYGNTKNAIKGKTLNSTSLYNLLIPLPPLEEQKRIVEKLNKLLPICENL